MKKENRSAVLIQAKCERVKTLLLKAAGKFQSALEIRQGMLIPKRLEINGLSLNYPPNHIKSSFPFTNVQRTNYVHP